MACMELGRFRDNLTAGTLTRREITNVLASAGILTFTLPLVSNRASADSRMEILTWAGYDAVGLRPGFDADRDIPPEFILYADNEEALEKATAGYRPTLVQPTNYTLARWLDLDVLKPINPTRLSNYGDVLAPLKDVAGLNHNGSVYGVPFAWGNSSVIYNRDLAPEYVGNESWNILWDEEHAGRLAQRDSMEAVFPVAAMVMGIDNPYNMSNDDLARVTEKLIEQREMLRFYWNSSSEIEQGLVSGELIAAYGWNASYAALKNSEMNFGYMSPAEGILTWVDCTCLIAQGPGDEQEAYDFLNAGISAEAGAFLIEEFGYGAANAEAFTLANAAIVQELGMKDPQAVLANARFFEAWNPDTRQRASLMFEELKAGF